MSRFKQHDITDCGVACLAYAFERRGLRMSLSALRQRSGTTRSGTTALGLVEAAQECGFEAKGVRCKFEDLGALSLPGIAHVTLQGGRQHYVVICAVRKNHVRVMDPAVGRVQRWPIERFKACWTNVFIILGPGPDFVPRAQVASASSRLLSLLGPQKRVLSQAFVGAALTTILSLAGAVYIQKIVDNVIVDGNRNMLRLLGTGMLVILALRVVIGYFQSLLMLRSAQKIDAGLLLGYYRHLMRLPQSFFDTMRVGEITSRMRDAVAVREFLNGTILSLVLNPLILVVALGAMFVYSWKLAVFSLALVPAYVLLYFASDWLNRRYQREIMERSADLDAQIVESLHSMSVVRSCGIEEEMSFRTEIRLVRVLKRVWSAANAGFVIGGTNSFLTQAYSVGLLWIGADLVLNSQLTAGELMSCNALAGYITGPIVAIIGMNASIRSATTATERLYEILDLEREKDEGTSELHLPDRFELVIEKVNFRYPGRLATLSDLSLRFQSGTITALVGKSGCGKSTLLALLQRHYMPDSGRIVVGDVELQYVQLRALRSRIAYVPQKIDLLGGTVLENIAPNEPQPDLPRIVELCRSVGILDFIESLPRGFQTLITENGANLSGGQKQRLAIVRALYSDAPIVLMDEPSSALDSESEDMLMGTLKTMRERGKLVILAVHNQRLLSLCDSVVEMADGKVARISAPKPWRPQDSDSAPRVIDSVTIVQPAGPGPITPAATATTKVLFQNLQQRSMDGILFGQIDANVMGIGESGTGWILSEGAGDILAVTGKRPAVYGFDINSLKDGWDRCYAHVAAKIREAYGEGGVITVVWHADNPAARGDCCSGSGVADLLPGGPFHSELRARLDLIAHHLGNLEDADGASIPILFRCWHHANGDHFWWGRSRCTAVEYTRLFHFTVRYLRDVKQVKNFLYSFSICANEESFETAMERYPGDDFVDVIGLDWFGDESRQKLAELLRLGADVVKFAKARSKIAGCTEIGFERNSQARGLGYCENPLWLRDGLIVPLQRDPHASQLAFLNFRRNEGYNPSVYNLPHPNSPHAACLAALADEPFLVFGDRSRTVYAATNPAITTVP